MAAPVTHIVLTDKIFDKYFSDKNRKEFYIGTSLPDIRYLGVIERSKTHFDNLTIKYLQTLSSFEAGLKFHSLVDVIREDFMEAKEVYGYLPKTPLAIRALKFSEDKIYYNQRSNWQDIAEIFGTILPEEVALGIKVEDVKKWHAILAQYFIEPSIDISVRQFMTMLGMTKENSEEIIDHMKIIENSSSINKIITDFYNSFEELIGRRY